jgi:hypothetical protein
MRATSTTCARRMNYSKERLGNIYSVHNNLPYAEPLAAAS